MAIWAGLSTASANSFIMPKAGEDLCSAEGELCMNFTEPLPHFYVVIWANLR